MSFLTSGGGAKAVALTLAAALAGTGLPAQRPPLTVPAGESYLLRSWDTATGLPQNTVNAILQCCDGVMWVATFGGLCRFDGLSWRVHDAAAFAALSDSRIMSLVEAADGELWFGSELGSVARLGRTGLRGVNPLPKGPVIHLAQLADGRIAAAAADDLMVCGGDGNWTPLCATPIPSVRGLVERGPGDLVLATWNGLVRVRDGNAVRILDTTCAAVARAPDGSEWIGSGTGLFRLRGETVESITELLGPGLASPNVNVIVPERSGKAVWCGTDRELCRVCVAGVRLPLRLPVVAPVRALHEDSAGGIWIGLVGGGLARLAPCEVQGVEIGITDGLAVTPNSVIDAGDGGWFVGARTGLHRLQPGFGVTPVPGVAAAIYGMCRAADGSLWLGQLDRVRRWRPDAAEDFPAPAPVGIVRALALRPDGVLLLGTDDGVWSLDPGDPARSWRPWAPAADLRGCAIKLISPGSDGSVWLAGVCQAVHIGAGGDTLARLRRGIELPNTEVRAILPGRDGRLWFATYGSGFVGLGPGATRAVAAAEGLPDPYLCGVVPTASGWLVGTNRGPLLVDPATLDDCADGRRRTIVCRQLQCTGNVATEANGGVAPSAAVAGGHAAMCAIGGLHVVDLDRLRAPLPPPVCHLEPLLAGDQRLEHGPDIDVVHLTSDRTLVLACSAPDFDRPEALFYRWRLRGGEWSEAKARRSLTVALPGPGDFDIEVEAIGNGERRSEEPTRLGVRVAAQPWEQPWLRLVAAIALVAFVAAGFRFGARRAAQQAKHLQVLVDERTHEIASARDLLEQRVEQRTLELEQALARLATDHEQRSLLERELEQMRRMESLGQLAGSVAHDFNNLLTVVLGNVDLLQGEIAPHDSRHELTRHIREAATRGREITQRLLAVASRQTVVPHVLDLAELLRAHLGVLRDLMGNSILVQLEVTGEPLHLTASPGQIDQILMNLAVNARDAMPRGGVLRLSASGSGAYVHLAVRDTGSGMAKEVRDRAFEPFFTTKKERGTGLGLATVYGITKQLQGEVTIDSAPGEGTGFLFTFPRASEPVEAPVVVPRAPVGRSEARILLIEDEPEVRRALRLLLEKSGYRVVGEAAGGAAGVHWLAEGGAAIDVVVSDVRMPGLHGIELVHALRGVRAGLPILFLSGHSSSARLLTELAPLGIEMITKPPTREELVAAIERALAVLPPAAPG